ncbi:ABC transporter ATP-binding protein [Corynebacterium glaucum]|uniref:ABC transporter ATP-binding protein n=1 Tax=Corynebacterium glaucum TaxID=187491 RepID=UPI00265B54D0|nr:ABC transporter ATP-binding protein [Corynebacterium glaucum]
MNEVLNTREDDAILSVRSVSKRFGDIHALNNVSFNVHPGEMVGVLGENGAGKSTLFSIISGLNSPTAGSVSLLGSDPRQPATRRNIGVTPQGTGVDRRMRVGDFLNFVAFHFATRSLVDDILEQFRLTDLATKVIGSLSGGQQRLVSVAAAFLADAPLTILDEPTTGLDTVTRSAIWESIRSITGNDRALMVSSHYIEEIEHLCDRVIVMQKGRLIADSETQMLLSSSSASVIGLGGTDITELSGQGRAYEIIGREGDQVQLLAPDVKRALTALGEDGWPFDQIEISHPSLEQAFITMTAKEYES